MSCYSVQKQENWPLEQKREKLLKDIGFACMGWQQFGGLSCKLQLRKGGKFTTTN